MKYIEEIQNGDIFLSTEKFYVLSSDFRIKNNKNYHMCIEINTGNTQWFASDHMIEIVPILYQDTKNLLHNIQDTFNEKNI